MQPGRTVTAMTCRAIPRPTFTRAAHHTYRPTPPQRAATGDSVDITRENFERMLPVVEAALQECTFCAIDCEMTGERRHLGGRRLSGKA
eukprot:364620-Chlamydomonas_euryale.AAC.8